MPVLPKRQAARFSMIHVDDLAGALVRLALADTSGKILEIANDPPVSWNDIVSATRRAASWKVPVPPVVLRMVLNLAKRAVTAKRSQLALIEDRIDDLTRLEWIVEQGQEVGHIDPTANCLDRLRETAALYREDGA